MSLSVIFVLFICVCVSLGNTSVAIPNPGDEVTSVDQKFDRLVRLLVEKDDRIERMVVENNKRSNQVVENNKRINQLEAKLDNQVEEHAKLANELNMKNAQLKLKLDRQNAATAQLQMKNSEILQLVTQREKVITEFRTRIEDLETAVVFDKRSVKGVSPHVADVLSSEKLDYAKSTKINIESLNATNIDHPTHLNTANVHDPSMNGAQGDIMVVELTSHEEPSVAHKRVAPTSVAFHAEMTGTKSFSTGSTVIYDHEALDQGNGYNQNDGVYNVPESGTYVITWTFQTLQNYVQTQLVVNGVPRGSSVSDGNRVTDIQQATATVVLMLNQGDHVLIRMGSNGPHGSIRSAEGKATYSGWKLTGM